MSSEVQEEDKTDGPSPGIFIAPYRSTACKIIRRILINGGALDWLTSSC